MGTSASFGGTPNKASLIPAFLDDSPTDTVASDSSPEDAANGDGPDAAAQADAAAAPTLRFEAARRNFTAWVADGAEMPSAPSVAGSRRRSATGRGLRRSLGRYAREGLRGSANAAGRMRGASRAALGSIGVLRDIQTRGIEAALRDLNLGALIGRSTREIFAAIIDVVCSRVETIDDDIAKQALLDSLLSLSEEQIVDLAELNEVQISNFYALFICKAIERRYLVDVSERGRGHAQSDGAYAAVDENVGRYIEISVQTRVSRAMEKHQPLDIAFTESTMTDVFAAAWSILESLDDGG